MPKLSSFAMITDIDESNVVGITQYEVKKLNFDGKNPLLFFFYFTSFNNFDFKISSNVNILEEKDIKYIMTDYPFKTFQLKTLYDFNNLYPYIYQIKNDNNFTYYASIYPGLTPDRLRNHMFGFKFTLTKPGEWTFQFLEKKELEINKYFYINKEYKIEPKFNVYINVISSNYFVIKQSISQSINNIFYSISKKYENQDEYNFDIKKLTCIEKRSNETLYKYCNISLLPNYKSRYLFIYPEKNTPYSITTVNHNEGNINRIPINSSYSNFIQDLNYELFGFTDSNYDNNFYVKIQIHSRLVEVYFRHFLINKNINDIYELKDEKIFL